ncbi:MAG: hypothetical protein KKG21_06315 [Candidatus Omnitrophica bacterium]|nr:hypothetical protein [Candidatus Omnitrophota bacterium]
MALIDYYKNRAKEADWFQKYFSLAGGNDGQLFKYINTNYRTTLSFKKQFRTFCEIEGIPRSEWPVSRHGQEKHKQHLVNMLASKLFYRKKKGKETVFHKTAKGKLYNKFLMMDFTKNEQWITNYLFLQDSYLEKQKNYIVSRTREIVSNWLTIFSRDEIDDIIEEFVDLKKPDVKISKIANYDFFILHSLSTEYDFLTIYKNASKKEKKAFKDYIKQNIRRRRYQDCPISRKYRNNGNFNKNMLMDEAKVLSMAMQLLSYNPTDFESFISWLLSMFCNIDTIDTPKLNNFLLDKRSIFETIFLNLYDIKLQEDVDEDLPREGIEAEKPLKEKPEVKIDGTTFEGKKQQDKIAARRKKIAREASNHTCELEQLHNCKYFTSKVSRKNYIEAHHLIPKEFANDFEFSIEMLANYVTLCPHCHRMIHLALDRERESSINFLYKARAGRLKSVGIEIRIEDLRKYNKIGSA